MTQRKKSKLLFTSLFFLTILFSGIYIYQVVEMGKTKYFIGKKEKELTLLKEENNDLRLAISKNGNLNTVENQIKELGYLKIGKVDFLIIPSSSIASNN
jgi:hypothetical protein